MQNKPAETLVVGSPGTHIMGVVYIVEQGRVKQCVGVEPTHTLCVVANAEQASWNIGGGEAKTLDSKIVNGKPFNGVIKQNHR